MKILQVASGLSGWGGIEAHVIALSSELAKRGHDVRVACQPGKFVEAEAQKRGLPIVPLTCRKKHDWTSARSFADVYRAHHFDVVHVHGGADHVVPPFVARRCGVPAVLMTRHSPKPLNAVSR
ncbi:MAG: glycosyltransferase, partial [Armatimonadetes bacterium]|nr:glycosyltransferase [Armatimonadota bacterium]